MWSGTPLTCGRPTASTARDGCRSRCSIRARTTGERSSFPRLAEQDSAAIARGAAPLRGSCTRIWYQAQIRQGRLPALRIDLPGLLVRHRAGDDHLLAGLPVGWRCDLVLRQQLQRVEHAQHLVEITPRGHWVDQNQLDPLVGTNDEYVAHGLVVG